MGRSVLIVDDDALIRDLMSRLVELLGFAPVTASNGREAARVFADARGDFVCVLLDVVMPVMGGPEALRLMRRVRRETPVVCVSGLQREESEQLFGECQPDAYLGKPCDGAQLTDAIELAVGLTPV